MKTTLFESRLAKIIILICFGILLATMLPGTVFSGGMPQTELRTPRGSGAALARGDYVSSSAGLNTYYSYFIEVPPGTNNLTVDVFDPDISGNFDLPNTPASNTTVSYQVFAPGATTATATLTCGNGTCSDNGWQTVATVPGIVAAGHWEFRMNMSSAITNGDELNGFAVRAMDTSSTNPKELNMYARSFDAPGHDASFGTDNLVAHVYPYVTSGCGFTFNEFDYDTSDTRSGGSVHIASRSGGFSQDLANADLSIDSQWGYHDIPGTGTAWRSDTSAADYGIWSANLTILGNNIVTYYFGNFNSTKTPPTAQPQANTFRTYMPTSAGGAPVKPFVMQGLSYVSGTNPPANGSTSYLRVQVDVVNPTPFAITFSTSNLVSAYVPGGQVRYYTTANPPTVTQGSIISHPANLANGGAAITWNPGTLAAGATASMTYDIRVIPNSTNRLAVTGTPASNGTTATYVDETGNTTQVIAKYIFGPLCELAVTPGTAVPTLATISSFSTYAVGGKVVVDWQTSSEINTVGFRLYRLEGGNYVPVRDSMLPAGFSHHKKGHYRIVDSGVTSGQKITYKLVEIESRGKTREYGPYEVTPVNSSFAQAMPTSFSKTHTDSAEAKGLNRIQKFRVASATKSGSMIRMEVSEDGIYALDTAKIASLLGMSQASAAKLLSGNQLNLTNRGKQIAYLPDMQNNRILFYGQAIKTNYTDENVYLLSVGSGRQMGQGGGVAVQPGTAQGSFVWTTHYEENNYMNTFFADDPNDRYWFWDYVIAGDPVDGVKNFNFQVSNVVGGDSSILLNLQGVLDVGQKALVSLNGTSIGSAVWDGHTAKSAKLTAGAGLLKEGINTLTVTGADSSVFFVGSFDVTYNRSYIAQGNGLAFSGGQGGKITVTGFTGSDIRVFDITDPATPKVVPVVVKNGSIGLRTDGASSNYIAAGSGAIKAVASTKASNITSLRNHGNRANYVIITTEELKSAAASLAAYRNTQGYSTMIATVEDIMDEFNNGIYSPEAIKSFIKAAYTDWAVPPKYIVLAGSGSSDYNDYWGYGGQQVPPALVTSPDGLLVSDNYYVDIDGDYVPEIAIGRLPASSAAELTGIINKIISYENSSSGDWTAKALLIADVPDNGGDFNQGVDDAASLFPNAYSLIKLYGSDLTATDMHTAIMAAVGSGTGIIDYFGHGNIDGLSLDNIFTTEDIANMGNTGRLPVITAMTCVVNNFALPGVTSLGEALVLNPTVGAVAVWSATGLSDDGMAVKLNRAFYSTLFEGKVDLLGDLAMAAIKKANLGKDNGYMKYMYLLLGDPAMKVKVPAAAKKR